MWVNSMLWPEARLILASIMAATIACWSYQSGRHKPIATPRKEATAASIGSHVGPHWVTNGCADNMSGRSEVPQLTDAFSSGHGLTLPSLHSRMMGRAGLLPLAPWSNALSTASVIAVTPVWMVGFGTG